MMRRALIIVGILIAVALAWQGRAPAEAPSGSPDILSPDDIASEEEVLVRIHGRKFIPSTARVHAGRHTKLVFRNEDAELHAFVPGALFNGINLNVGGNGAPEFGEQGFRKVIIPGEGVAELRFVLSTPGHYPYICDMPGHEMRATIVVE